jgi:cytochrome oxidase Cu insertion factor (SCO1/SenC/PrrC family)
MRLVATLIQSALLCCALVAFSPPIVAQNRTSPVAVGEMAPEFTLESHQGTKITLSEARGKSPAVLVFYRGYW